MVTATFRPRLSELDHDPRIKNDPLLLGCSVGEMAPAISGVPDRSTAHNLLKALAAETSPVTRYSSATSPLTRNKLWDSLKVICKKGLWLSEPHCMKNLGPTPVVGGWDSEGLGC
ncbi:unnamed protein product [Malus baccata var. baccata]